MLEPIALALIAAIIGLWCILPGGFKKNGLDVSKNRSTEVIEVTDV